MTGWCVCVKHKAIMSFPSEQFYDGRLSIGSERQAQPSLLDFWPAGNDRPIVFAHIEGVEQTLTVATEDGSEKSKSNVDEVLLVVSAGDCLFTATCFLEN